ncbi:oligosaccharide repeat unit polymerase [Paenibacillus wynnii]|uniref:Oligosaccharide repeat unit polymerase n=1 Tax=Paenibacillus wynnii TaxID=268407 RepID=A0A098M6Z2_9BACL|nr:oligosaccharide repeat unit polymerase [Paenibacillus wynnii]KGE18324.1 hypothetical protein PWYN_27815 [Paenibacillus wynnii]
MGLVNKKSKKTKYFTLNMGLFRLSLDSLYVTVLNNYHEQSYLLSSGVFNMELNAVKYVISWIIYLIAVIFIDKKILKTRDRGSEIIILGLFIMSFVPSISLFGLANLDYEYLYNFVVFWSMLLVSSYLLCNIKKSKSSTNNRLALNNSSKYYIWLAIIYIFCLGVFIISWRFNGFKLNITLDSIKIYELRSQAKTYNLGTIVEYFRNNAMYIIIPFAGVYCWQKKNWIFLLFLIYIQLHLYSIDNQKAALFILPASILAYIFYRKFMVEIIPLMLILVNILIYIESIIGKSTFLVSTALERIYYLPAILSNCYFEYFKDMPSVVPFVSVFEKIGFVSDYPYTFGVPYILGGLYFHNPAVSANTGLFGSAYSYGPLGIIFIPVTYAFLFYLLDKVTSGLEIKTYISILIVLIYAITGATIFVVLSVYGYIMALILLSLVNKNNKFQILSSSKSIDYLKQYND